MKPSHSEFERMEQLWLGPVKEASVSVAVDLNLFEVLNAEQHDSSSLALRLGLNEPVLGALLRCLTTLGYLQPLENYFVLTRTSELFLVQASEFDRSESFLEIEENYSGLHLRLRAALQKGGNTLEHEGNSYTDMWRKGEVTETSARQFTHAMQLSMQYPATVFSKNLVFTKVKKVVDLGGGSGAWAKALTKAYPEIQVTIADLPPVLKVAEEILNPFSDLKKRIHFKATNFFEKGLPEGDAYLLSNILHDWNFKDALSLLKNLRSQVNTGTTLFIHECLLEESMDAPEFTVFFHLLMVINHGSQQFTRSQLNQLLLRSGFSEVNSIGKVAHYELLKTTAV